MPEGDTVWRAARQLDRALSGQVLLRLVRRAKAMLEANKERVEQTTTGDQRRGRRTWVYRRDRESCRRCGTSVSVAMTGDEGRERATYWCPSCQV